LSTPKFGSAPDEFALPVDFNKDSNAGKAFEMITESQFAVRIGNGAGK
jgi:hypothetical protein